MSAIVYISFDGTICMPIHLAMQCLLLSVSGQEREGSCIFVLEVLMLSLSVRLDFGLF